MSQIDRLSEWAVEMENLPDWWDNERAHIRGDEILVALVRLLAHNCDDPVHTIATKMADDFERIGKWYA